MTAWSDVEAAEPEFARRVQELFDARKHKTIATLRADGSPRISGIEAVFKDGRLTFGSMPHARKGADLLRDPRFALHSATVDPVEGSEATWPGEAKISGWVTAAPLGEGQEGDLFRADVAEVVHTHLDEQGDDAGRRVVDPGAGTAARHPRLGEPRPIRRGTGVTSPGTAASASAIASASGMSRAAYAWWPAAVVATRVTRPARRWNQDCWMFQPMMPERCSTSRRPRRLPGAHDEVAVGEGVAEPAVAVRGEQQPRPAAAAASAAPPTSGPGSRAARTTASHGEHERRRAARGCSGDGGRPARAGRGQVRAARSRSSTARPGRVDDRAGRGRDQLGAAGLAAGDPGDDRARRPAPTSRRPSGSSTSSPRTRSRSRLVSGW